jgi:hypothetical protein
MGSRPARFRRGEEFNTCKPECVNFSEIFFMSKDCVEKPGEDEERGQPTKSHGSRRGNIIRHMRSM